MSDVASPWITIRVELVSGRGERFWPRPGRIFAADPAFTFGQLANAIDEAFGRWDLDHLHAFELADGTSIGIGEDPPPGELDSDSTPLERLRFGDRFIYEFDFGASWLHLCTVEPDPFFPEAEFTLAPPDPWVVLGAGTLPDQYGFSWLYEGDPREPIPTDPGDVDIRTLAFGSSGRTQSRGFRLPGLEEPEEPPVPLTQGYAWFSAEEWAKVGERWPQLHRDKPADHQAYSRMLEAELVAARAASPTTKLVVSPMSIADLVDFALDHGLDARSSDARAWYAAEVARTGMAILWPPDRSDPCWCGSGRRYLRCCGTVAGG